MMKDPTQFEEVKKHLEANTKVLEDEFGEQYKGARSWNNIVHKLNFVACVVVEIVLFLHICETV